MAGRAAPPRHGTVQQVVKLEVQPSSYLNSAAVGSRPGRPRQRAAPAARARGLHGGERDQRQAERGKRELSESSARVVRVIGGGRQSSESSAGAGSRPSHRRGQAVVRVIGSASSESSAGQAGTGVGRLRSDPRSESSESSRLPAGSRGRAVARLLPPAAGVLDEHRLPRSASLSAMQASAA